MDLYCLRDLPKLESLCVGGEKLNAAELSNFAALDYVEAVYAPGCSRLIVRDCPRIQAVEVVGEAEQIELRNLPRLTAFSNRNALAIPGAPVTTTDERAVPQQVEAVVANLPSLETLDLMSDGSLSLDARCLPALKKCCLSSSALRLTRPIDAPKLRHLRLAELNSAELESFPFRRYPHLKRLELRVAQDVVWRLERNLPN